MINRFSIPLAHATPFYHDNMSFPQVVIVKILPMLQPTRRMQLLLGP